MKPNTKKGNHNLLEQYDNNYRLYQSFVIEMEHQIKNILNAYQITCNAIVSRLKSKESLAEKIERKQGKYADITDITDIAGIRIIAYYSEDVDKIAEIIEREYDVDHENSIDKREAMEPDRFGYCSVHYVVKMNEQRLVLCEYQAFRGIKCEIQIRSVLQHAWAEIEHDIGYKSEITIPKEMRRSFSRIAGLLEIADNEFNDIRKAINEYKDRTQNEIEDTDFAEREIDSVVLEVMIEKDPNIQRLNRHIGELIGKTVESTITNEGYAMILRYFEWLGIKTVRQVADLNSKYADIAMKIADEKLKNYKGGKEKSRVKATIAFFYLCYAILLMEKGSKEQIYNYLIDNDIGREDEREDAAHRLYDLGTRLK